MKRKLAALCALALAITACMGSAASANSRATARIQEGNNSCGMNQPADPVFIGGVVFKRNSTNTVTVKVKVKRREPGTLFTVEFYANGVPAGGVNCELLNSFTFQTNGKGNGVGGGSWAVPAADTEFYVHVTSSFVVGGTPYVSLP